MCRDAVSLKNPHYHTKHSVHHSPPRGSHALQALQRHLPRPTSLDLMAPPVRHAGADGVSKLSARERAEDELATELQALLQHDAAKYPVGADGENRKKSKRSGGGHGGHLAVPSLPEYSEEDMRVAATLLDAESGIVRAAMGHVEVPAEEYLEAWQHVRKDLMWAPAKGRYDRAASATPQERVDSYKVSMCHTVEPLKTLC